MGGVAGHNLKCSDVKDKKHRNRNTVQKTLEDTRKELECEAYHCSDVCSSHSS